MGGGASVPDGAAGVHLVADRMSEAIGRITATTIESIVDELPSYRRVPAHDLERSIAQNLKTALAALESGRVAAERDFLAAAAVVPARVEEGVSIEDVIRAYRMSISVIENEFVTVATGLALPASVVLAGHRILWAVSDRYTASIVAAFRQADLSKAVREHQRRMDFVGDVIAGTVDEPTLRLRATSLGLDPAATYHPVRIRVLDDGDAESMQYELRNPQVVSGLVVPHGADAFGLVSHAPRSMTVPSVVALGPAATLADMPAASEVADRVFDSAWVHRRPGVYQFVDLTWRTVVRWDDVGVALARRYIDPCVAHGEFGQILLDTVRAYLEDDRRSIPTARKLSIHPNTLRYRIQRFEQIASCSLDATATIVELAWLFEAVAWRTGSPDSEESREQP
ncbi:hypothetical protein G352_09127 [Rhodococcus ruber BKS 20-38]|uniref:Uncharacterized protein n=2 Tax=Rhodococcus ruber TaxID=1830 RepID=M2XX61_9NOCA|nr:hypothetical protein G352_09127 [Rhodococcus ruber BKS 20-38]